MSRPSPPGPFARKRAKGSLASPYTPSSRLRERGPGGEGILLLCFALLITLALANPTPPPAPKPIPNLAFTDLMGTSYTLQAATKATVLVFLSTECPISKRYVPRLVRLEKVYRAKGVRFFAVYPNAGENVSSIRQHTAARGIAFPVVRDGEGTLTRSVGASVSPEVAILDGAGRLRYRGRIDDSDDPARVRSNDLRDSLDSLLAGKPVKSTRTKAFGCYLSPAQPRKVRGKAVVATPQPVSSPAPIKRSEGTKTQVTYTRDIAPLLNKYCVECHRTGEVGPMALDTYKQASAWARQMCKETMTRQMPPWRAASHGEFRNERRMYDREIQLIENWSLNGTLEGDPKDLPEKPVFASGWKEGEPDYIGEMPAPYTVPAEGRDFYRCFVIPTNFDADKWVASIEFQPGNRAIVHHINVWLDTSGEARKLDAADAAPGYDSPTPGNAPGIKPVGVLGGWIPGHSPWTLPEGVGNRLPKGADIVFEVHYITTGKPEQDRSRFGLRFVKGEVKKPLVLGEISARTIRIPAGEKSYRVETSEFVRNDITLLSMTPHMHYLGRSMTLTATFPDGTERRLVYVPNWDFNWQMSYRFKEPLQLPAGTRLDLLAIYDNSADNPKNPNKPPKAVHEGERTVDEMANVFLAYTLDEL